MSWGISDYVSLTALIISILVPISQLIFKKVFKRIKIDIVMFGNIFLLYDSYGSYLQSSFTVQCENEDITIKKIELTAKKRSNNCELNLIWGYMLPIDSKFVNERAIGKRAHPVKIYKDSIEPYTVQFYVTGNAGIYFHEWLENYSGKRDITDTNLVSHVNSQFFWDAGTYDIEIKVFYNKNRVYKYCFELNVTKENELQLLKNVNTIIEGSGNYSCIRIQNFA